jgi:hypothetical protein
MEETQSGHLQTRVRLRPLLVTAKAELEDQESPLPSSVIGQLSLCLCSLNGFVCCSAQQWAAVQLQLSFQGNGGSVVLS